MGQKPLRLKFSGPKVWAGKTAPVQTVSSIVDLLRTQAPLCAAEVWEAEGRSRSCFKSPFSRMEGVSKSQLSEPRQSKSRGETDWVEMIDLRKLIRAQHRTI